jgi:hypothetical protein
MRLDDWLEDLDDPDADVDELVARITVDAFGDEGCWSFRQVFEDHVDYPVGAALVGVAVAVTEISFDDERRGLTATVQRKDHTSTVSLLDLDLVDHQDRLSRLTHAYRHWLGLDQR